MFYSCHSISVVVVVVFYLAAAVSAATVVGLHNSMADIDSSAIFVPQLLLNNVDRHSNQEYV